MSDEAPAPPAFDAARLIADLRAGDEAAVRRAYLATFGTDLGRLVLTHHMAECGVGNPLGPKKLKYAAGMHDGALKLAAMAGFDQSAINVAVISDNLEGRTDDEAFNHPPRSDDVDDLDDVR